MAFAPLSRIATLAMAAVVCFGLLVPLSLARHNVQLALFLGAGYLLYVVVNVLLWHQIRR